MNKDFLELSLEKAEFNEACKLAKKIFIQVEKLDKQNPAMALIFLNFISDYAEGYTGIFLENNNIAREKWNEITNKVRNFELEDVRSLETLQISDLQVEGWGFPPLENSVAHYFLKDRHSLCKKYIWLLDDSTLEQDDGIRSSDDCLECWELLCINKILTQVGYKGSQNPPV